MLVVKNMLKLLDKIKNIAQKETVKNLKIVSISKVLTSLIGLLTISLIARGIGTENFGKFALLMSLVEAFNFTSFSGVNNILNRSIHLKKSGHFKKVYHYSLFSSIFGAILFYLLYLLNIQIDLFNINIDQNFLLFILLFIIIRSQEKHNYILNALNDFLGLSYLNIFASILNFIFLGVIAIYYKDLNILLIANLIQQTLLSFVSRLYCHKKLKLVSHEKMGFVKDSIRITLVNIFDVGVGQIDKIILSTFGFKLLGEYQAGISYPDRLREVLKTQISVVMNTWLSFGSHEFHLRLKRYLKHILFLIILSGVVLFFAPLIYIPLFFGENYSSSIPIAQIFTFILLGRLINYFLSNFVLVFNVVKTYQQFTMGIKVLYIVIVPWCATRWSVFGVLYSIIFLETLSIIINIFLYKKTLRKESS